ncbi:putative hemoglobin and hemoglobin-haptoglobin-binding protein 3 precursor [Streptomyces sp. ADI96-02]|uniref:HtaA domain-containing protein n=1 Tax=Streptomyces sp. ADI96-02 TaxID=1522760 RepID=UPI000F5553AB|nr:HtaA domain-containing protein [Streptomyces sp. ADI96-02]RPK65532.1 putative hemoglobin and hemoglobin-haptoglobin-binding protein 3 precursor [Streptomyces sp. ADI96-02]
MAAARPLALAAAVATAAALGATFALPALAADSGAAEDTAASTTAAPKVDLTDGTLDWGFKESFRKYLASPFAHGKITVSGGARQAADNGAFTFVNGKGVYDTDTHGTDTAFEGAVNFSAHQGVLDITLSDLKVSTTGKGGAITADVKTPQGAKDDVAVAALDLSAVRPGQGAGGAMVFKDIPATLTKAGSEAFNGQYKEGDALDPATLSVKQAAAPPTGGPTDEPTDRPTEKPADEPTKEPTKPTGEPTEEPGTDPTDDPAPDPSASQDAPPVSGPVVDGTLNWGVKESFRSYVTGPIARGKVETSGGATASGDGYRFGDATGSVDADKNTLNAAFRGTVRFLGHEADGAYALDLSLGNLKIDAQGVRGKLLADVSTKDRGSGKVSKLTELHFADLELPVGALKAKDGVVSLAGVPATLTEDGSEAFSGMYEKGERLDALTAAVSLDEDAQLPGGSAGGSGSTGSSGSTGGSGSTTGGSTAAGGTGGTVGGSTGSTVGGSAGGSVGSSGALASTGSDVPTGALIAASGLVVAAGAGTLAATRRRRATA